MYVDCEDMIYCGELYVVEIVVIWGIDVEYIVDV